MQPIRDAAFWINHFSMSAHPEGGHFAEMYRSKEFVSGMHLPARFKGLRAFSTSIYFLVEQGNFSALHRIQSDEIWHFYAGDPLTVHVIHPDGKQLDILLGNDVANGQSFQAVVPAGSWFGSKVAEPGQYALVGCTVAPGFEFADFELAKREPLTREFPQHAALIASLTRS